MHLKDYIRIYDNVVSDSFCDKLINILHNNETYEGTSGDNNKDKKVKDSSDLDLTIDLNSVTPELYKELFLQIQDPIVNYINTFIPNREGKQNYLTNEDASKFFTLLQPPKLKKYKAPDQGYHAWHQDLGIVPPQSQRLLVVMLYLNDVKEGGETSFYHQNIKIKPEKGTAVLFPPYYTHMHKGESPISNDKYICNIYIGINPKSV